MVSPSSALPQTQMNLRETFHLACEFPPSPTDCDAKEKPAVSLLSGSDAHAKLTPPYRVSPIYPVSSDPELPKENEWLIGFFEFRHPFQVIARVLARAPELSPVLWFSLGSCSCLVITDKEHVVDLISQLAPEPPNTTEIWKIRAGVLYNANCTHRDTTNFDPFEFSIEHIEDLEIEIRGLLVEFIANIQSAARETLRHLPEEINTYRGIAKITRSIAQDLLFIERPNDWPCPPALAPYTSEAIREDSALRSSLTNQRIDQLVQLNSTLSYVISQAFFGSVPILEHVSLIRMHGLLGVGTAHRALVMIARTIELAFERNSIEALVLEQYPHVPPLPNFEHASVYDPEKWQSVCGVDKFLASDRYSRESLRKLPLFSGRLGFRETQFSISSALQVLFAGDGRAWHLSTMTHEMTHGHVRNLLGAIFKGQAGETDAEKFRRIYQTFADHMRGKSGESIYAIDSIRSVILSYCCLTHELGSLTRSRSEAGQLTGSEILSDEFVLLSELDVWKQFEREYRNLNELFVLVLDLHYFYRSELVVYLQAVWQSWSAVPGVIRDLRQYVIRSLLSAASMPDSVGDALVRFRNAVREVVTALEPISSSRTPRVSRRKKCRIVQAYRPRAQTTAAIAPKCCS